MQNVRSMTAYGQASAEGKGVRLDVELRGVNSRYLDLNQRLPGDYQFMEGEIRGIVAAVVPRGRVDLTLLRHEISTDGPVQVRFQKSVYTKLLTTYKSCCGKAMEDPQVFGACVRDILSRREVLDLERQQVEPQREAPLVKKVIAAALQAFEQSSRAEGARLARDLTARFSVVRGLAKQLTDLAAQLPASLQERLTERIRRIDPGQNIDPARVAAEVVVYVDRADVTEELVRISAHLDACAGLLGDATQSTGEIGKRLDFLMQELNREFTTTGNKCQSAPMQHAVVAAKAELEKIREQIQNIV